MGDQKQEQFQRLDRATRALLTAPLPDGPPPHILKRVIEAGREVPWPSQTEDKKERFKTMKYISKIAALVVVVLGLAGMIAVFHWNSGANIVFADVVQPLMTARTVVFNAVAGKGEETFRIKVMNRGTQLVRQEIYLTKMDMNVITILDLKELKQLNLVPKEKAAVYIDIKGIDKKDIPPNYLEMIRTLIARLQAEPEFTVEELGEQDLDGRTTIAFRAAGPGVELKLWADPRTALPVRIEQKEPHLEVICSDFQFDVDLDPALFNMAIPEGYKQHQAQIDVKGSTEKDLIEALRLWAEEVLEGTFPDDFSRVEFIDKMMPILKAREERDKAQGTDISDEQKIKFGMTLNRGLMFVEFNLKKPERHWHYVGGGVKFGDAQSPVCWYLPEDAATYRVIYGDLSVKDVPPEELPPLP